MRHLNRARVIAAAAGAVLSGVSLLSRTADGATFTWTGAGNSLNASTNWSPVGVPTVTDTAVFQATGQNILTTTGGWTAFAITFDPGAQTYDLGGTNVLTMGTTTPTGGNITNNSSNVQTFDAPVAFRIGTVTAANANLVFNGTFNVGNNSNNNPGRNVTIAGGQNVFINGALIGTPAVSGTTPQDTSNFGQLIKNGTGTLYLTNNNNNQFFTGRIVVNSGQLQANVANAFGANGGTAGTTYVSGGANTGRVELIGGVSFANEVLNLQARTAGNTANHLLNVSGDNTWNGPVNLTGSGTATDSLYAIQSDANTLTIAGNVTNNNADATARTLTVGGAGNGLISGNITSSGTSSLALAKGGTGTWTLTGVNTYAGGTTISAGTLAVGNGGTSGALGSGAVVNNGSLVFNRSDTLVVNNAISGTGNVVHAANSSLTLGGSLSYQGSTTVQAGTLTLSNAKTGGGAFVVGDTATLTLNSASTTTTMATSNFTVGGGSGSTLNFALGTSGNPTVPVINSGGLTRNGVNTVNILGSNFSAGTIKLVQYAGTEGGTGSFSLGALPNRVLANLNDTGSELDLNITSIDFPKWTGALNATWDTTVNANPKNWVLNSNGVTPTDYIEGDSVLFNDSSANGNVNITTTVSPNAVAVNNGATSYVFSGAGKISGAATLTKTGTGTLTIANTDTNDFTGAISIGAGGTLQIGAGGTSGTLGSGAITNSGLLVLNRSDGVTLANNIGGAGNLTVLLGSTNVLSGNNTYDGVTTVSAGATLTPASANALGSTVGNTVVQSTGSIYANSGNLTFAAEPITISGVGNGGSPGALHAGGGFTSNFTGPITLAAASTLQADTGSTGVLSGVVSGTGIDLTIDGAGTWALTANGNSYANTIITGGTLSVGNGGTTGSVGTGTVDVGSAGTLNFNRSDNFNFSTTVTGSGGISKSASGTVTLTAANTFGGGVTVNQGIIRVANSSALGSGTKTITVDTRNKGIELDGGVTIPSSVSWLTSNDGDLTQGTIQGVFHSLTGANVINGDITLKTGGGNTLVRVDAGGSLTLNGNVTILNAAGARALALGGAGTGQVNGIISDGTGAADIMSLQLNGAGGATWTLNGANTFTGTTSLQSGTFVATNNQSFGLSPTNFVFIGNGGAGFAGVSAAITINTPGVSVPNKLWTNKDGAGLGFNQGRTISYTGATGSSTFAGSIDLNGGVIFKSNPNTTLVLGGTIQNGTDVTAGVNHDVFVNADGTVLVTAGPTYTGATTVQAGRLALAANLTSSSAVLVSGGTLELTDGAGGTRVIKTPSVSTSGTGRIDIQNNKIITQTPVGTWNGTSYTGVTGLIASGKGTSNLWDGSTGIVTSQSAAVGSNHTSIAIAQGSEALSNSVSETALWAGQTITGTDTLVMYTYGGDANLDGKINIDDYVRIDQGIAGNKTGWSNGDFNYDGKINIDDYTTVIDSNIGSQNGVFPTAGGVGPLSGVSAVPEPAGLAIFSLVAPALLRRRRRHTR